MKSTALETTLGDLIVALTDEATRSLKDEGAAYQVVAYIVSDLLEQDSSVGGNKL
jgi:hypothetical protein